jgi:hypothetical protein
MTLTSRLYWERIMLKKYTLIIFLILVTVMIVIPYGVGIFRSGSQRTGFPLKFFESNSGPPPFFGSTFSWKALLIDLFAYYIAAVGCVYLWEALKPFLKFGQGR